MISFLTGALQKYALKTVITADAGFNDVICLLLLMM